MDRDNAILRTIIAIPNDAVAMRIYWETTHTTTTDNVTIPDLKIFAGYE